MLRSNRQVWTTEELGFVCPSCRRPLLRRDLGWECVQENFSFAISQGIPDLVLPSRRERIDTFLSIYQKIRSTEGWGSTNVDYYLSLPYRDLTGNHRRIWKTRARTFERFFYQLAERNQSTPLRLLDVGAGNCWMSIRLADAGWLVVAADINMDSFDGLGVAFRLGTKGPLKFSCVRAEFDYLPFPESSFDVIVFNASLHYSKDTTATLLRALRLIKDDGALYILDSPLYQDGESGKKMVEERRGEYRKKYGISIPDEFAGNFLTYEQLDRLQPQCTLESLSPHYGMVWNLRPVLARLLSRREPASFEIVILRKI
ncbi:MAG: class I SAM-dependent methyltransferase [Bacteroidota bacterium]